MRLGVRERNGKVHRWRRIFRIRSGRVAAILLGVNVVRYLKHITVSGFSLVLGFAALLAAFSRIWRTDLPVLAICLLGIGASLVAKPFLTKAT
jgi:hypothetical protein